jgi:hypothetical protein
MFPLTIKLISLGKGKGLYKEKRIEEGMLRPNLRKGCKTWAMKGKGFWKSFFVLLLDLEMRPQDLLLYDKNIVNRFGDGLQGVKWLGNRL